MSKWDVVLRFLPQIWEARRMRNQIKSRHIRNLQNLDLETRLYADFSELDESVLGEFAVAKHYKTKSKIQSIGYPDEEGYIIHDQPDQDDIKGLTRSTIRRIRLKNFFAIIFWMVFAFIVIVGFGIALSLPAHFIISQIASFPLMS